MSSRAAETQPGVVVSKLLQNYTVSGGPLPEFRAKFWNLSFETVIWRGNLEKCPTRGHVLDNFPASVAAATLFF